MRYNLPSIQARIQDYHPATEVTTENRLSMKFHAAVGYGHSHPGDIVLAAPHDFPSLSPPPVSR